MAGILYVVATPIGNLGDITLRALETLKNADLIACEDTRHSKILLNHYGILKPLTSFYEQNSFRKVPYIIGELIKGRNVAVISEAGTPAVSDPGFVLVKAALDENIKVVPLPGCCAAITAVCACGLPTDGFIFLGFLPRKPGKIKKIFRQVAELKKTIIFYESPYRVKTTLAALSEILPADADVVVARELTKIFEEFIKGKLSEIAAKLPEKILGEITVLISLNKKKAEE